MDLEGRIDKIVDGGGDSGAPAPGLYRAEGDPWTYVVAEGGDIVVFKEGDKDLRKPTPEQLQAIQGQISDGTLSPVETSEEPPDFGTSQPDGMGESKLTDADKPGTLEEPDAGQPAGDTAEGLDALGGDTGGDEKPEGGAEGLDPDKLKEPEGMAGTRQRLEDTLDKAAKRYEDKEGEGDEEPPEETEEEENTDTMDTGG